MQGEDKSSVKLGLEYNDDIVAIMTFAKSRFNKGYNWELTRFCVKGGISVVGGFSRLLKAFRGLITVQLYLMLIGDILMVMYIILMVLN